MQINVWGWLTQKFQHHILLKNGLQFRLQAAIHGNVICSRQKGHFTSCWHTEVYVDIHEHHSQLC